MGAEAVAWLGIGCGRVLRLAIDMVISDEHGQTSSREMGHEIGRREKEVTPTCSIGNPAAASNTSLYSSSPSISLNPSSAFTNLVLALNNLPQISSLSSGFSCLHFKIPRMKEGVLVPASTSARTSLNPFGSRKGVIC